MVTVKKFEVRPIVNKFNINGICFSGNYKQLWIITLHY
jgi:hypothetical protein